MELDAAIFDFGGVLTTPIRASFAHFEQRLGLPEGSLLRAFIHHGEGEEPPYFRLERGELSERDFMALMIARLKEETGIELPLTDKPGIIRDHLFGALERNEDMIIAAATIGQHYKTAILSNNVKEWIGWREMADAHLFDVVVDSSDVGYRKPDPEIYRLTCERLGVEPSRAVFVDDIPSNVEGAQKVGLHAIRFTTTDEVLDQLRPLFPRAFAHKETSHA
ncbi:MAG: HAD family hydrolase [Actinomycetota bacterium]